jgi:hypothetical protein
MKNKKKKKSLVAALILLLFLLAGIILYLLLGNRGALGDFIPDNPIHFTPDNNSEKGGLDDKSKDNMVSDLNQKVDEGTAAISMNPTPIFKNGKAKGNLRIINETINRYPQQVNIYTKDTNQLIYSGGVDVGCKIESSSLSVDLPKGIYECVAIFTAIDTKTNAKIGDAGMNIKITVLN